MFPSSRRIEQATIAMLGAMALASGAVLFVVTAFVVRGAWPAASQIGLWRFLSDGDWHPVEGMFGLAPMLAGSLASSIGALLIAVPVGIAIALACHFQASERMALHYRRLLGVYGGIPSVVYGYWGLTSLVPLVAESHPPGASLFVSSLVLALMIMPTVALTSRAALARVPRTHILGGHALGLSRDTVALRIALRGARAGVLSGIVLALARALGETMAVLMVSGNIVQVPQSVFDPIRTLAANIALEMAYAMGNHRAALYTSGVVLIVIVCGLMLVAEYLTRDSHG